MVYHFSVHFWRYNQIHLFNTGITHIIISVFPHSFLQVQNGVLGGCPIYSTSPLSINVVWLSFYPLQIEPQLIKLWIYILYFLGIFLEYIRWNRSHINTYVKIECNFFFFEWTLTFFYSLSHWNTGFFSLLNLLKFLDTRDINLLLWYNKEVFILVWDFFFRNFSTLPSCKIIYPCFLLELMDTHTVNIYIRFNLSYFNLIQFIYI